MMSLTSPSHLRGKSIGGGVFLDEVDAATPDPAEGDPILLAEQRVTTFQGESPVVISSTPTTKHGAISVEYDKSDKRLFYCSCPHCQVKQTLEWENVKFEWEIQQGKKIPIAKGAKYVCPHCQQPWTEGDRIRAIAGGKFRATNPISNIIGFHITRLVSPLATVESIVQVAPRRNPSERASINSAICSDWPVTSQNSLIFVCLFKSSTILTSSV